MKVAGVFFVFLCVGLVVSYDCSSQLSHTFRNEKGQLELSWDFEHNSAIIVELSLPGTAYVAMGWHGGMVNADIVLGWVEEDGSFFIGDYFATQHSAPPLDTTLGGTDDVVGLCGSFADGRTTIRYKRKLDTGDKYDQQLFSNETQRIIWAWNSVADPGTLAYHQDNHSFAEIDFTKPNGIPDTTIGQEETGYAARQMLNQQRYGTLITLQTQYDAGGPGMQGFPYGSVASYADTEPSTGQPILLLSYLERNVINFEMDNRCSLSLEPTPTEHSEPMMDPRMTIMGSLNLVPDNELPHASRTYLRKHPQAKLWAGFSDFHYYYFNVSDVYYVGGFGTTHYIGWVDAQSYLSQTLN